MMSSPLIVQRRLFLRIKRKNTRTLENRAMKARHEKSCFFFHWEKENVFPFSFDFVRLFLRRGGGVEVEDAAQHCNTSTEM